MKIVRLVMIICAYFLLIFSTQISGNNVSIKLKQISDKYSKEKNVLVLYDGDKASEGTLSSVTELLKHSMKEHGWAIQLSNQFYGETKSKLDGRPQFDLTFVFLEIDGLMMINNLGLNPFWNPGSKILVVVDDLSSSILNICLEILETSWRLYRSLDMTIMIHKNGNRSFCLLNPFSGQKGRYLVQQTDSLGLTELFPKKISNNIHGFPLCVKFGLSAPFALYSRNENLIGLDIDIIFELRNRFNFSLVLLPYEVEATDMFIGGLGLTSERYQMFDTISPHYGDNFKWIVPRKKDLRGWERITHLLSTELWFALSLAMMLSTATLYLISLCSKDSMSFGKCNLLYFSILLNVSVPSQPTTLAKRILFISFVAFTMHFSFVFNTSLISVLTMPRERNYQSIEEVVEDDLCLVTNPDHSTVADVTDILQNLSCSYVSELSLWDIGRKIALQQNSFSFTPERFLKITSALKCFDDEYGISLVHGLSDRLSVQHLTMLMKPRHPLLKLFDSKVSHMKEAGLIDLWVRQSYDIISSFKNHTEADVKEGIITLFELQSPLIVLGIGLGLSFFVFFIEIFVHFLAHRRVLLRSRKINADNSKAPSKISTITNFGEFSNSFKTKLEERTDPV